MEWESEGFWARLPAWELERVRSWVRRRLVVDTSADIDRLLAWMPEEVFEEIRIRAATDASPKGLGLLVGKALARKQSTPWISAGNPQAK